MEGTGVRANQQVLGYHGTAWATMGKSFTNHCVTPIGAHAVIQTWLGLTPRFHSFEIEQPKQINPLATRAEVTLYVHNPVQKLWVEPEKKMRNS